MRQTLRSFRERNFDQKQATALPAVAGSLKVPYLETHGYPDSVALPLPVFGKNLNYLRRRMVT